MPFLIDSDVPIDISPNGTQAINYVDRLPGWRALSQVTAMELIGLARNKRDIVTIDGFLSLYAVLPLSEASGRQLPAPERLRFRGTLFLRQVVGFLSLCGSRRRPQGPAVVQTQVWTL